MSEGLFCRERGGKLPAATAVMAAEGGPGTARSVVFWVRWFCAGTGNPSIIYIYNIMKAPTHATIYLHCCCQGTYAGVRDPACPRRKRREWATTSERPPNIPRIPTVIPKGEVMPSPC